MTEREKLIELLNIYNPGLKSENIADYLLKNGVVVLPCKVGDVVYQVNDTNIFESTIKNIIYDTENIAFDKTSIGLSIFLTREEAEKVLERRKVK